jgi:protocatechuate 3,4-dioxygenase, beta subunit
MARPSITGGFAVIDSNPPYLQDDYHYAAFGDAAKAWAPRQPLIDVPAELAEHIPAPPALGRIPVGALDYHVYSKHPEQPIGQRVILRGRVLGIDSRPVPDAVIETWQVNAAGAYVDAADPNIFPQDPNFTGLGRCITDIEGRYELNTIRPANYQSAPLRPGRPAHIHVSIFGHDAASRLITQCYFADDPLFALDDIATSSPVPGGPERLIAQFERWSTAEENVDPNTGKPIPPAFIYKWDIVLRGRASDDLAPQSGGEELDVPHITTPSQTVGPLYGFALMFPGCQYATSFSDPDLIRIKGSITTGSGPAHFPDGMLEFWDASQFVRTRLDEWGEFECFVRAPDPEQNVAQATFAPSLQVAIFSAALVKQVRTVFYFPNEAALEAEPILGLVGAAARRRLIGCVEDGGIRFDIRLSVSEETPCFAF